eukprot:Clim_evm2s205 gene=Clim_evmTU2s205
MTRFRTHTLPLLICALALTDAQSSCVSAPSSPFDTCNDGAFVLGTGYQFWDLLMSGSCDMKFMALHILESGSNFDLQMRNYLGRYVVQDDPIESVMAKINTVVAAVLMTPFYSEAISEAEKKAYAEELYGTFYKQASTEVGTCESTCAKGDLTCTTTPWSIHCPTDLNRNLHVDEDVPLKNRWWVLDWTTKPQAASSVIMNNDGPECETVTVAYSRTITTEHTTTVEESFGRERSVSTEMEMSVQVSGGFGGMDTEFETSLKSTFEQTIEEAYSSEYEVTESESITASSEETLQVPAMSILVHNVFVEQVEATLLFSLDSTFEQNEFVNCYISTSPNMTGQPDSGATMNELKALVERVNNLLKLDFSQLFIDQMFTASVGGSSTVLAGSRTSTNTHRCIFEEERRDQCTREDELGGHGYPGDIGEVCGSSGDKSSANASAFELAGVIDDNTFVYNLVLDEESNGSAGEIQTIVI